MALWQGRRPGAQFCAAQLGAHERGASVGVVLFLGEQLPVKAGAGVVAGGSYEFEVTALDSNGCPGKRHFSIDVYQPVTPEKCHCYTLIVKIDPTLLNKKRLPPDKHDFGVGFEWRMTCSPHGIGGCQGELEFKPPKIIAGTLPKSRGLHLSLGGIHTSVCSGPCNKTTFGRFEIKLRSRDQLNKLFGRVLAFRIDTNCRVFEVEQVEVFVDKHGVLRRPPPGFKLNSRLPPKR